MLVLDTGVLVAAARRDDRDHEACARLLRETRERRAIPAPVLVEVDHHLRGGRAWQALVANIVDGAFVVEDLTLEDYTRAVALQERYADLRVGFVDCGVLAVVERLGEQRLATLDHRHFRVLRPRHVEALALVP